MKIWNRIRMFWNISEMIQIVRKTFTKQREHVAIYPRIPFVEQKLELK